jgi:hypothetical protein
MQISIDTNIIISLVVAAAAWLLFARALEPRARAKLRIANTHVLPQSAAYLASLRVLRLVFSAAAIAGAVILIGTVLLQAYLHGIPATAEGLDALVSARNAWERTLGLARVVSLSTWIGAVLVLAAIWWFVVRSRSRRNWSEAIGSRRRALAATIADLSGDALRSRARDADSAAVGACDEQVDRIRDAGAQLVQEAMESPLITIGDQTVSLNALHALEAEMQQEGLGTEAVQDAPSSREEVIHDR